ncbi:MAG TPA: AMP-binding protein [Methylomirabilota bacterium]|nr:AMP-binding protein [Methylomirabilota bacterium]
MTLAALLERAALRRPDADAVVDGPRRLSYRELAARAAAAGAGFARLGVRRGDRVLIALRNRLEHVVTYWALQTIGGVPTPVNFRLAAEELRYVLADSGAALVVFEASTAEAVRAAAKDGQHRLVFVGGTAEDALAFDDLCGAGADVATATPGESDLSLILYTSGTTGRPKGVPRSHRNHYAGALAQVVQCGYTWGERTLGVMPLYHTMGIHSLTSMAAINGCFVCQPEWRAAAALQLIAGERLTALYLIPTLFYDLVHAAELAHSDVSSVRKLAYAGAPMLAPLTEACDRAFRPAVFVNHYGSTEIYTFTVRPDVQAKPGCAGRPGIHGAIRVVTASPERRVGPDDVVPPGDKGEIIASLASDEAFAGYWNRPDADARALRDGWYFTGDMGWLDGDGELHVAGRVDDMIISGGENIHPVEVEEALARHAGVADVAVIGEPDARLGERVVAFVVPRAPGLTAEALDAHCRTSGALAAFKRPRRVVFVKDIPKTASGKILRRLLRDGRYSEITP